MTMLFTRCRLDWLRRSPSFHCIFVCLSVY